MPITRLAPSPTGALHLGNARTFLVNWLMARQRGWRIVLRIEDIDGPRLKAGADVQAVQDLHWLGIHYDDGPIHQTARTGAYQSAIRRLLDTRQAYPCTCTRREVELAASAPHAEDGAAVYPGTCRDRYSSIEQASLAAGKPPAIRFRAPDEVVRFEDAVAGSQVVDVARQLGDFVIAKSDGTAAYQLAVVVDDAEMRVAHVVRGDDLLDSTPRQILLYRALDMSHLIPQYCHLPLIVGDDGRRLAKRHGDTRLSHYRERGVPAARVRALLARWSGMPAAEQMSVEQMVQEFALELLPRQPMVFTAADDEWLMKGAA
jgi:glutamyl-tRNA synthetase